MSNAGRGLAGARPPTDIDPVGRIRLPDRLAIPHELSREGQMRKTICLTLLAGSFALGAPAETSAQSSGLLAVGAMAPDFVLPGATRYGVLEEPVRLSDYRGETVVLAFFFRVRTRG